MKISDIKSIIKDHPIGYYKIIKSKDLNLYNLVKNKYPNTKNMGENFWLYVNGFEEPKKCRCGAPLTFMNVIEGYKQKCLACYKIDRKRESLEKHVLICESQSSQAPECQNPLCDNLVSKSKKGLWEKYCSRKCRGQGNSLLSREKAKSTMLQNYGVEHALQSKEILDRMYGNNLLKYGSKNIMSNTDVRQVYNDSMVANHGYISFFADKEKRQKMIDDLSIKFGHLPGSFTNVSQIPEVQEAKMKSGYQSYDYQLPSGKTIKLQGYENIFLDKILDFIPEDQIHTHNSYYEYDGDKIFFPDIEINNSVIDVKSDYTFFADYDKNMKKAEGIVANSKEMVFLVFNKEKNHTNMVLISNISKHLEEVFQSNNVPYLRHQQYGKYIVNIEIDNKYVLVFKHPVFSSEIFYSKDYFSEMNLYFESIGKRLILIDRDSCNQVFINSLLVKIHKSQRKRIHARKCQIVNTVSDIHEFLSQNHIQGYSSSSIIYGLEYENEIIAVMLFNKFRKGIGKDRGDKAYELVRYVTSYNVPGGASRLLKAFIKDYGPEVVYSYSDNQISDGNLYIQLGFELERSTIGHQYCDTSTEKMSHRFKFRKGNLKNLLSLYDEKLSESQLMKLNHYVKVFDAGKKTWVLNID